MGLVVAARDVPASRFVLDRWPRLHLAPLSGSQIVELLRLRTGTTVHGGVAERLLKYAEGNPLALVEIAAALTPAQLSGSQPLPATLPLSPGLEAAFLDQIRRLPVAAQHMLLIPACAQGAALSQVIEVARLMDIPDRAEELERSGLVVVEGGEMRFRHPPGSLGGVRGGAVHPAPRRSSRPCRGAGRRRARGPASLAPGGGLRGAGPAGGRRLGGVGRAGSGAQRLRRRR
ncbi:MAG TPA: hypothetical protein VI248_22915 [Kineosporiaceae bacterium]